MIGFPFCQCRRGVSPLEKRVRRTTMSDLRELAHLREQLGDERFAALISSDNTGKVKEFCDGLVKDVIPTTMTIAGRTYDILSFLREDKESVVGHTMVERAKEMLSAHLGEDDGRYILDHQDEIPAVLRGKIVFVFTDWRRPDYSGHVYYVCWDDVRWIQDWGWLDGDWGDYYRVLRRK